MAGRGPKPARVKEFAGNPGKRPLERDAINPPPAIPPCPEHLNAVAQSWQALCKLCHDCKTAKEDGRWSPRNHR